MIAAWLVPRLSSYGQTRGQRAPAQLPPTAVPRRPALYCTGDEHDPPHTRPRNTCRAAGGRGHPGCQPAGQFRAASSGAAATTLCNSETAPVGGAYTIENNEWGSGAPECITPDGNADFMVANSSIANATDGAPGGYPAIYKGCHWGACTPGSGLPIQVSDIRAGTVTTSWSTSQPGGSSDYDVAYDIWFNQAPTTSGQPNGTELMIWLNHHGPVRPFGSQVASNVSSGGRSYNVWFGNRAGTPSPTP